MEGRRVDALGSGKVRAEVNVTIECHRWQAVTWRTMGDPNPASNSERFTSSNRRELLVPYARAD